MRFAGAAMFWMITTMALMIAIPAIWAQRNVIDDDGYAALAERAAHKPALQSAMASELTTRAMALINERGGGHAPVDSATVHDVAAAFTAGPSFPPLFAQANRAAHAWLFSAPRADGEQWEVDLAPMLKDPEIQRTIMTYNVQVPATVKVPLTVSDEMPVRQGQLRRAAVWGPWVSFGAAAVAGVFALLTVVVARSRGRALTSLGISALLVGGVCWAGLEVFGRYVNQALNQTTGDIRQMADVLLDPVEGSLHQWFNATLVGGAGLVVFGVFVAVLGSLFTRKQRPAT